MNALLVSDHVFPSGSAGAVREYTLAAMLHEMGYSVIHIGANPRFDENKNVSFVDNYSEGSNKTGLKGRVENYLLFDYRVERKFERLLEKGYSFDVILLTDLHVKLLKYFKCYCRKNKSCKLIYNVVEWYSKEHHRLGIISPAYQNNNMTNKRVIDKSVNVISISSYLHRYFTDKGILSCNIPFVLDSNDFRPEYAENQKCVISYIGRPSNNKDHLKEMLEGVAALPQSSLEKLKLNIVGISENDIFNVFRLDACTLEKLRDTIHIYGLLPREEALRILKESDFTFLLRSNEMRYAKAGFPTKVCESLMYGIPVICNITSDLDKYIIDGSSGIVVQSENLDDIKRALLTALSLNRDQLLEMKKNARKVAEVYLDYRVYKSELRKIL